MILLLLLLSKMGSYVAQAGLELRGFPLPPPKTLTAQAGTLPWTRFIFSILSLDTLLIFFFSVKNVLSPLSVCAQLASLLEDWRSRVQQAFQNCKRIT